jgi:hypothetical protein
VGLHESISPEVSQNAAAWVIAFELASILRINGTKDGSSRQRIRYRFLESAEAPLLTTINL